MSFPWGKPTLMSIATKAMSSRVPYAERVTLIRQLLAISGKDAEVTEALRTLAFSGLSGGEKAIEPLVQKLPQAEAISVLCQIIEKTDSAFSEEALEQLGRLPATSEGMACLCRRIRIIFKDSTPFYTTSRAGRAAKAAQRLAYSTPEIAVAPLFEVLLEVACKAKWDVEYESPALWALRELTLLRPETLLNEKAIPVFRELALREPLDDQRAPSRLQANRYLPFLETLAKYRPMARQALEEIEKEVLARRSRAIPAVLDQACTHSDYAVVADRVYELEDLARKGIDDAAKALAHFRQQPARTLSRRRYKTVDLFMDGMTVSHEEADGHDMVSTRELGQQ